MATTEHAVASSLIKAVRIAKCGGSVRLKYEEVPLPRLGPNRVLAKVRYAGVNPVDWKIREGSMKQVFPVSFPLTRDFSGEIVNAGGDSGRFPAGERVFGFGHGTYAEFTEAAISDIARIPEKIDFPVAAALPRGGPDCVAGNSGLCPTKARNQHSDPWRSGRRRLLRNPDRLSRRRRSDRGSFRLINVSSCIVVVAIATTSIHGIQAKGFLARLDDFLYLPEVLYVLILVWLIFSGPGRFSVDGLIASRIGLFGVER